MQEYSSLDNEYNLFKLHYGLFPLERGTLGEMLLNININNSLRKKIRLQFKSY